MYFWQFRSLVFTCTNRCRQCNPQTIPAQRYSKHAQLVALFGDVTQLRRFVALADAFPPKTSGTLLADLCWRLRWQLVLKLSRFTENTAVWVGMLCVWKASKKPTIGDNTPNYQPVSITFTWPQPTMINNRLWRRKTEFNWFVEPFPSSYSNCL